MRSRSWSPRHNRQASRQSPWQTTFCIHLHLADNAGAGKLPPPTPQSPCILLSAQPNAPEATSTHKAASQSHKTVDCIPNVNPPGAFMAPTQGRCAAAHKSLCSTSGLLGDANGSGVGDHLVGSLPLCSIPATWPATAPSVCTPAPGPPPAGHLAPCPRVVGWWPHEALMIVVLLLVVVAASPAPTRCKWRPTPRPPGSELSGVAAPRGASVRTTTSAITSSVGAWIGRSVGRAELNHFRR